jgi:hypothetical protein
MVVDELAPDVLHFKLASAKWMVDWRIHGSIQTLHNSIDFRKIVR